MKLQTVITSIFIAVSSFTAFSSPINQNVAKQAVADRTAEMSSTRAAHRAAHKEQFAAARLNRIDKSVISDFIIEDVRNREESPRISPETSAMIDDLLKEANTHIGKRYRSGAKGPSSFDCSGFSSYVYRQFGYNISPSSRMQYTEGIPVDRKDLRKGDLVFFTSRSSGKNVGHVGIVVSADNEKGTFKFIHASIKGVKISDFEGYYVGRYVGAKRIISE